MDIQANQWQSAISKQQSQLLGKGLDIYNNTVKDAAITTNPFSASKPSCGGTRVKYCIRKIITKKELKSFTSTHLDLNKRLLINTNKIPNSVLNAIKINTSSTTLLLKLTVLNPVSILSTYPELNSTACDTIRRNFEPTYGQKFINGVVTGGDILVILHKKWSNEACCDEFDSSFSMKYLKGGYTRDVLTAIQVLCKSYGFTPFAFTRGGNDITLNFHNAEVLFTQLSTFIDDVSIRNKGIILGYQYESYTSCDNLQSREIKSLANLNFKANTYLKNKAAYIKYHSQYVKHVQEKNKLKKHIDDPRIALILKRIEMRIHKSKRAFINYTESPNKSQSYEALFSDNENRLNVLISEAFSLLASKKAGKSFPDMNSINHQIY